MRQYGLALEKTLDILAHFTRRAIAPFRILAQSHENDGAKIRRNRQRDVFERDRFALVNRRFTTRGGPHKVFEGATNDDRSAACRSAFRTG